MKKLNAFIFKNKVLILVILIIVGLSFLPQREVMAAATGFWDFTEEGGGNGLLDSIFSIIMIPLIIISFILLIIMEIFKK